MLRGPGSVLCVVYRRASRFKNSLLSQATQEITPKSTMKAYIRTQKEERVEIKFRYVDSNLGLDRWFSLNRSMDDTVQQIKDRIVTNIDKACLKFRKKKMKKIQEGANEEFKLDVQLTENSEAIGAEVACRSLLVMHNVAIVVNGQCFQLDVDPPTVKSVKLPTSIMAGFPVYPSKLEVEYCNPNQCEFKWFKCHTPSAPAAESDVWILVGTGLSYTTSNLDIGSWLKLECIPKSQSKEGLPETAIASQRVEAGPGLCPFEIRQNFTKEFVGNDA